MNAKEFDVMMSKITRIKGNLRMLSRLKLSAQDREAVNGLKHELKEVERNAKDIQKMMKANRKVPKRKEIRK